MEGSRNSEKEVDRDYGANFVHCYKLSEVADFTRPTRTFQIHLLPLRMPVFDESAVLHDSTAN